MKSNTKRNIFFICVNTAVMILLFLYKYIMIPQIISYEELVRLERGTSGLAVFLFWVPIPLISIVGMIIEQHLRYWIIPDVVYCLATLFYSRVDHTYGIGMFGFFGHYEYNWNIALISRLIDLVLMLLLQLAIKLLIMLVKKIDQKIKSRSANSTK